MSRKKINFSPDASQLSAWGAARQPFFALFNYDRQLIAGEISQSDAVRKAGVACLSDNAVHYRFSDAMRIKDSLGASTPANIAAVRSETMPALRIVGLPNRAETTATIRGLQAEMRAGRSYLINYCTETAVESSEQQAALFGTSSAAYTVWLEDHFVSFSPESFISVTGNIVSTCPMKGTGTDAAILLADAKEQAEHATVVDLLRNDLGQVATAVKITDYRYLSRIDRSTGPLYQTSTRIAGQLPSNWRDSIGDWFPKLLPAGSISGAPKQESIGLIRAFETAPRGFFTGVALLFDGENLTSAVLIRYLDFTEPQLKFRSGAGITIYSDANAEYDEIISKVYIPQ